MKRFLFFITCILLVVCATRQTAQAQNGTCASAAPACLSDGLTFQPTSSSSAEVSNNYGCLDTPPNNPSWFYVQLSTGGTINAEIAPGDLLNDDIDYALWGPFADLSSATATCGSLTSPISCSYSGSASELATFSGSAGDVFLVVISDYTGTAQSISFTQTGGGGATDCSIISTVPNDDCAGAIPVSCNSSTTGSNVGALPDTDTGCSNLGVVNFASGVWYSLSGAVGNVTVSTCANSDFDTELVVYSGSCGSLTCIEGHDIDDCGTNDETITFTATAGSTYLIYVTGHSGLTGNYQLDITCAPQCSLSTSATQVICRDDRTGTATATPADGEAPYSYFWNTVPPQLTQTAIGLAAGTYSVTVTDSNGCSQSAAVTVTEPATSVVVTASPAGIACFGGSTSATATASGGNAPYSYLWSNGQTTATAVGLVAGVYTVVATDASGCSDDFVLTIGQPTSLSCSATSNGATCGNNNGTATVSASGGTPGYSVVWSNGATTATASNLAPGSYSATVTDANGCTCASTSSVSNLNSPNITSSTNTDEGAGGPGPIDFNTHTVVVSGGSLPYEFTWDNTGYVTYDIEYTAAGATITIYYSDNAEWSVTITDNNGCTNASLVASNLNDGTNSQLDIFNYAITGQSGAGAPNGAVDISASGGGAGCTPYSYLWSNGATTQDISGVPSGWYSVTVTCANGSQHTVGWYWVPKERRGRSKTEADISGLTVMPNPFANEATVTFSPSESGISNLSLYSIDGKLVRELFNETTGSDQIYSVPISGANLISGLYVVVLRTSNGDTQYYKVVLAK